MSKANDEGGYSKTNVKSSRDINVMTCIANGNSVEVEKLSGPGQAQGLLAQYPVRREWFRPKILICLLVVSEVRRLKNLKKHEFLFLKA